MLWFTSCLNRAVQINLTWTDPVHVFLFSIKQFNYWFIIIITNSDVSPINEWWWRPVTLRHESHSVPDLNVATPSWLTLSLLHMKLCLQSYNPDSWMLVFAGSCCRCTSYIQANRIHNAGAHYVFRLTVSLTAAPPSNISKPTINVFSMLTDSSTLVELVVIVLNRFSFSTQTSCLFHNRYFDTAQEAQM